MAMKSSLRLFVFPLLVALVGGLRAADPVRLYIANDDHTDYMWTADADTYGRVFVEQLDYYLKLTDETLGNPPPYQSRFNADGSLWLWEYERRKTPAEFARLIDHIKSGHLSAPLNAAVACYGAQPTEAVLRGMYYAGRLERRFGLRFTQAVAMENQSFPLGLASLWAGSGAEFSWRGVCGCASKLRNSNLAEREHEIYWCTGIDGQRVLMKWHSFAVPSGSKRSGGYAEAFDPVKAVHFLSSDPRFLSRYRSPGDDEPYRVRSAFGFGWDALDRKTGVAYAANPKTFPLADHFHLIAQRETTADLQVIVSNQEDFFRDFAEHYGAKLPAESVTYGNEWDLYSASMAETSARVRRSVEKLRTAEALATLVGLRDPAALGDRVAARDQAFMDLGLYWEHDFTADGPVSRADRAAWQDGLADAIGRYVDGLQKDATARLSTLIPDPGAQPRFFAFNPLGWTRTDAADFPYDGPEDIHVRDLTAAADTPHQFVMRDGVRCLRILARDLPPVGYKVFELRPGPGDAPREPAATFDKHVFENLRVKLVIEGDGALASFVDKRFPAVEFAAAIGGLKINDFAANDSDGHAIIESSGPVSVTVRVTSDAGRNHVTRVTLYRESDRVDLHNEITENFGDVRHWAFSFNLAAPDVRTEELGAIIRLKKQSDGGHYAERNARYDYATLNHFADIYDGTNIRGVTLSNWDCAFMRLGQSTPALLDTATAQLNVLAGGQVDGDRLGIRNQNGTTHFVQRFALRAHGAYDPVAAMRFALEHQNPPVTGEVTGGKSASMPAESYSLLTVSDSRVLVWAVKPAEEGIDRGVIARLWNVSDGPVAATLAFSPGLASARRVTHIETDLAAVQLNGPGALPATFVRQQMQTYRLQPR
jgi:alpha-mannosidase